MSGAKFAGTDQNGEPFQLQAKTGRQEYDTPDVVYLDVVSGNAVRLQDGQKLKYDFSADLGEYSRKEKNIRLRGEVRVFISNGDQIYTDEMLIKL